MAWKLSFKHHLDKGNWKSISSGRKVDTVEFVGSFEFGLKVPLAECTILRNFP